MAFEKDPKGAALIEEAITHAHDVMSGGYKREVAITETKEKFGVPREVLEEKVPFVEEGEKAADKGIKRFQKKSSGPKDHEGYVSKADGTQVRVLAER